MSVPSEVTGFTYPETANIESKVALSWEEVAEATSYTVERKSDDGEYTSVYTGTDLAYNDDVKLGWDICQYRINATNDDGDSGYVESAKIAIVYFEIDGSGRLQPLNTIVDFSKSKFDTLPTVKESTEDILECDGVIVTDTKYDPRLFYIVSNTDDITVAERNTLLAKIGKVSHYLKTGDRYFRYNEKLFSVRLSEKPDEDIYPIHFQSYISLKANDPYGYSSYYELADIDTTSKIITSNGDVDTYPTLIITNCSGTTKITINGVEFNIGQTFLDTDTCTVDCEERTVTKTDSDGTVTNIKNEWVSDNFPVISSGNNTVNISQGTLKVIWQDKYISLGDTTPTNDGYSGTTYIPYDTELSDTSTNAVQNKVIKQAIDDLSNKTIIIDTELSNVSENAVQNKVIKTGLDTKSDVSHAHTLVNNHTVESDVPENAVFTDTTYGNATDSTAGLMSNTDKTKLDGLSNFTVDTELSDTSTNAVANSTIKSNLDSKANTEHTHTVSDITDFEKSVYQCCPDGSTTISSLPSSNAVNWSLNKILIPSSVKIIFNYFACHSPLEEIIGGENVETVGSDFLSYNYYLKQASFPKLTTCAQGAFYNNSKLTDLSLIAITTASSYFLSGLNSLINLDLGSRNNVLTIGTNLSIKSSDLTVNSFLQLGNALVTTTEAIALTFSETAWNNLSDTQKAIFTDKGYTITTV